MRYLHRQTGTGWTLSGVGFSICRNTRLSTQATGWKWAIEHQVKANRLSTAGLIRATRALVWVTIALVFATGGQVLVAVLNYLKH